MHFLAISLIVLSLVVFRFLYNLLLQWRSPLRDVPGPFWARFTNLWFFEDVRSGKFHVHNIALHKKYALPGEDHARVVRVGPNMYSIASPDKVVYGIASKMPKSKWYEGWKHPSPDRWTLFPDRNTKRHAETRRKFQSLYSLSSLLTYEQFVDECAAIFVSRLNEIAARGEVIDMFNWFQNYAFDVIGDITYSKRFGFLDEGKDIGGVIAALNNALKYSTLIGIYHWLHPLIYKISEKIPGSGAAGRNYIMKFAQQRLKQRETQREVWSTEGKGVESQEGSPRDFLDRIMDMKEDGSKGVTDYHVFMMCLSNIIAGGDTTGISLSAILYNLVRSPSSLERLREEVRQVDKTNANPGEPVMFKDTQSMPYLQACIKEGLRLHPATGLPLWRVVPEGGAEICGRFFPAGSEVGLNAWVAHYDRDVWGDDAAVFRPERWLEAEQQGGERLKTMDAYYMPFGLGSRTCLGRHISYLEISKLIPLLITNFDFILESTQTDWDTANFWFVKPVDFALRVKAREQN